MGWEVAMTTMGNNIKFKEGDGAMGLLMSSCAWRDKLYGWLHYGELTCCL